MENFQFLKSERHQQIVLLKINRPDALNALNSSLLKELRSFLRIMAGDESCRVLVITGEGKAFVAGADIAEMADMDSKQAEDFSRMGQEIFSMLEYMNIPVIAAVNGYALGGGCELAMACDFRIAGTRAKFGQPEVSLGLIPGYAGTQRMPRLLGLGNALYYLMTADQMDAEEAYRTGLVQKVVNQDELIDEAINIAGKIASKGPLAVSKLKQVARRGLQMGFEDGSHLETREFGSLFGNEGTEGMRAFLEKRKPNWNKS